MRRLNMGDDSLSDEDKALFRETMRSVTPLKQHQVLRVKGPAPEVKAAAPPSAKKVNNVVRNSSFYLSDHYTNIVGSDTVLSYCKQSIPQKRLKQLKNGQIPWQARLDLHGCTPDSAREALCEFIGNQSQTEHRCLLIIHGKGSQRGEAPILKNYVNHWLPQFPQILAFHSCLPRDGGTGALYVLLQRQRVTDTPYP